MDITTWQTETTAAIAGIDAELEQLLAAVRTFKAKAARAARSITAGAERLSEGIYDAHEASNALLSDDADPQPMSVHDELLLDQLADLPSATSEGVADAVNVLVEYRRDLAALARQAAELGTGGAADQAAA